MLSSREVHSYTYKLSDHILLHKIVISVSINNIGRYISKLNNYMYNTSYTLFLSSDYNNIVHWLKKDAEHTFDAWTWPLHKNEYTRGGFRMTRTRYDRVCIRIYGRIPLDRSSCPVTVGRLFWYIEMFNRVYRTVYRVTVGKSDLV